MVKGNQLCLAFIKYVFSFNNKRHHVLLPSPPKKVIFFFTLLFQIILTLPSTEIMYLIVYLIVLTL